ncbi:small ribosomal subunit Rsm22 family protein [Mesorhizobium sp. VNQ89]|uniref:small ribosomal subunit Rsm22 family protein n=1 Tax=Mesorhizobium quangtriensis TaxID=3157709 RepID=UPI0032B71FBC
MELPVALRQAVERYLEGTPLDELRTAADRLSRRYRAEMRDGRLHLDGETAMKAYLAARLPATYAAIRASMNYLAEAAPDFAPRTLIDVGAGPGSVLWAASDCWNSLEGATMIEASDAARKTGLVLAADAALPNAHWIAGDATRPLPADKPADLVTLSYVLDELAPDAVPALVDRLWALTAQMLLVVEPGTPAGWQRILTVRGRLIEAGAHVAAPCPHESPCPLIPPDWCHFSRRVARSRLHRLTKNAEVPWEDEKFIYLAASRPSVPIPTARIIASPQHSKGRIELKLCLADGDVVERLVTKRDGEAFRRARRVDWGDTLPTQP